MESLSTEGNHIASYYPTWVTPHWLHTNEIHDTRKQNSYKPSIKALYLTNHLCRRTLGADLHHGDMIAIGGANKVLLNTEHLVYKWSQPTTRSSRVVQISPFYRYPYTHPLCTLNLTLALFEKKGTLLRSFRPSWHLSAPVCGLSSYPFTPFSPNPSISPSPTTNTYLSFPTRV